MAKKDPFHPVGDILGRMLKGGKWELKIKQYSFLSKWEAIVGKEIAKQATPTIWRGNTLFVEVKNAAWMQELRMMESDVVSKIRRHNPEIKIEKIRWVLR